MSLYKFVCFVQLSNQLALVHSCDSFQSIMLFDQHKMTPIETCKLLDLFYFRFIENEVEHFHHSKNSSPIDESLVYENLNAVGRF